MGIFDNPQNTGSKSAASPRWGPNQEYYNGLYGPDGLGHGHRNLDNGFDRPPVANFLGNTAIRGAGGQLIDGPHTPRW